jgi:antirestriction protein ArdC
MLWAEAMAKGYAAPIWMTFKQALILGGCVRRGEKGSLVVYSNSITRTETDADTNEETATQIHYMKGYTVFNVEQIDELTSHYYAKPAPPTPAIQRIERVEGFFAATRADICHGGDRACYIAGTDHIQMPPLDSFRDAESYYATLAHEGMHWTKHRPASTVTLAANAGGTKATRWRNWSPNRNSAISSAPRRISSARSGEVF